MTTTKIPLRIIPHPKKQQADRGVNVRNGQEIESETTIDVIASIPPFVDTVMPTYSKTDQLYYSLDFLRNNKWLERIRPLRTPISDRMYAIQKRAFDFILASVLMLLLGPLFLLCMVLIKLESSDGPIFFAQERTGKGGRRFKMYKFRTMVANAEEMKKELMHLNELEWPDFKITNDPRVTRIGRILRKTSLDEIPQLLNIVRGEMSFVGPRPTSFQPTTYDLWQTQRLEVIPGLTGLWQIYGRGETEFVERVYIDILYIQRRCIWLDLQLILRTGLAVVQGKGRH